MICPCPVPLNSLLASLSLVPPAALVVPAISGNLVMSLAAGAGYNPSLMLSGSASASAAAAASAAANLSAMASVSAAFKAAFGMDLAAALSAQASAGVSASLAAAINGFNANAGVFVPHLGLIAKRMADLAGLVSLSGLLLAVRASFGIDMRGAGAMAALQARLSAAASAKAAASATAAVRASASASAVASAMLALGLKANAQGALSANAQAQALAGLTAGLPAIGAGFNLLAMLAGLLSMLNAVRLALGVNLLAPGATLDLRLALSQLPLHALAALSASVSAAVSAGASATATASAAASTSAAANAAASLNLAATASANLSAASRVAVLLDVMAKGGLGLPAGSCAMVCPLALLQEGNRPAALAAVGTATIEGAAGVASGAAAGLR